MIHCPWTIQAFTSKPLTWFEDKSCQDEVRLFCEVCSFSTGFEWFVLRALKWGFPVTKKHNLSSQFQTPRLTLNKRNLRWKENLSHQPVQWLPVSGKLAGVLGYEQLRDSQFSTGDSFKDVNTISNWARILISECLTYKSQTLMTGLFWGSTCLDIHTSL